MLNPFDQEEEETLNLNPWNQVFCTVIEYIKIGAPNDTPENFAFFIHFILDRICENNLFNKIETTIQSIFIFLIENPLSTTKQKNIQVDNFISILDTLSDIDLTIEGADPPQDENMHKLEKLCNIYTEKCQNGKDEGFFRVSSDAERTIPNCQFIEENYLLDFSDTSKYEEYLSRLIEG